MTDGRCGLMGVGLSFLVGCVVGGTTALLYAPQSGARTRRRIVDFAEDLGDRAGDVTGQVTEKIQKATEHATEKFHQTVERGRNLVNT
ncbi:MAG: YtxH domain-containing protein [Nitrospira sp.]|nr:YtxH domain-containing protein [Nitrospira sp.]MDH4305411.1 YtxH domain-containing protein [Nitrospira sp.]MDH5194136.1 YtxH domain-containing protein [Nitrospira sp.]